MKEIFIVDDSAYIRKMIQMVLEQNGFLTRGFGNGNELLKYLENMKEEQKPMLILLDIMMPEVNGFEVLEKVSLVEELKKIPIIMLSVKNQKDDVLKALKLGARDYIVKPPEINLLLQKIKKYAFLD